MLSEHDRPRDIHEDARDLARRLMGTKRFLKSRDERKRVEMRFAHLKTHHGFERMRLRGLSGARDEFHLAAIVQNLKTLALRVLRPPPSQALPEPTALGKWFKARASARPSSIKSPEASAVGKSEFFDSIEPFRIFGNRSRTRCIPIEPGWPTELSGGTLRRRSAPMASRDRASFGCQQWRVA